RTAVEIEQVGTAPEQHMLAIVDNFAGAGVLIRGGAPAQVGTALKQRHAKSGFRQGAASGEAGQPAAGDRDCRRLLRIRIGERRHHSRRFSIPFPRTVSFSRTVNRARSRKTSYWFAAIFSSKRR